MTTKGSKIARSRPEDMTSMQSNDASVAPKLAATLIQEFQNLK